MNALRDALRQFAAERVRGSSRKSTEY